MSIDKAKDDVQSPEFCPVKNPTTVQGWQKGCRTGNKVNTGRSKVKFNPVPIPL